MPPSCRPQVKADPDGAAMFCLGDVVPRLFFSSTVSRTFLPGGEHVHGSESLRTPKKEHCVVLPGHTASVFP